MVFDNGGEPRLQAKYDTVDVHLPGKVVRDVGQVHRGVHRRHRHVPVQQILVQPPSQGTESPHYLPDEVFRKVLFGTVPNFLKSLDLLHVEEKEMDFPVDVLQLVSDVGSRHRGVGRLGPNRAVVLAMTMDLQRKRV